MLLAYCVIFIIPNWFAHSPARSLRAQPIRIGAESAVVGAEPEASHKGGGVENLWPEEMPGRLRELPASSWIGKPQRRPRKIQRGVGGVGTEINARKKDNCCCCCCGCGARDVCFCSPVVVVVVDGWGRLGVSREFDFVQLGVSVVVRK